MLRPRRRQPARALALAALGLLVLACGGPQGPQPPKSSAPDEPKGGGPRADEGASSQAQGPRKPSCADGTCFECGEVACLKGFYCEVPRPGAQPACGSLAACAQSPTCACVTQHVKGCSCEDRNGVAHLRCGS